MCTRLVVTAETEHGERSERVWFRARGLSAGAMVERIRWQLDGWMAQPGALSAGVVLLRLDADEVRHDGGDQLRLWGGVSAADERAVRTIARLAGLAGEEAVRVPAWRGGRLPGDRYRWVPATTADLTDPDDTASRLRPTGLGGAQKSRLDSAGAGPWPGALPAPSPAVVIGADGDGVRAVVADEHGAPIVVGGPRRAERATGDADDRRRTSRSRSSAGPDRGRSTSAGGTSAATAASPASRSSPPTAQPTSSSSNASSGASWRPTPDHADPSIWRVSTLR